MMRRRENLPKKAGLAVFLALIAVSLIGCGKKKEEEDVIEIATEELAPLEEKAVAPAVESQVPESDPNSVGNMVYYPNSNAYLGALAGSNTITLYFEKEGVTTGQGRVSVYSEEDYSLLSYVDVTDNTKCRMEPMDNNGMQLSGWEGGTMATLYMSKPFSAGKSYFVLMDAGCFKSGEFESKAITNPSLMTIVAKPYGIASDIHDKYNFGDTAILSILTGGDCKRVLVQDYDSSAVLPSQTMMTSPGEIYFTFMKEGTWSFKLAFYDDAVEIDSITYTVTVAPTAADVLHDSAGAVNDGSMSSTTPADTLSGSSNSIPQGSGSSYGEQTVPETPQSSGIVPDPADAGGSAPVPESFPASSGSSSSSSSKQASGGKIETLN